MKNTMTKKTVATLTTILLAQPLMAIYTVDSNDCYTPTNVKSKTIDISKFNHVWQKLHRDNSKEQQAHLQMYIDTTLDNTQGTLDVTKFSSVWQNLHADSTEGKEHLSKYMETLLENASESYTCSSTPLVCNPSIDIDKFSTLWNEIKVNDNHSTHLISALNSIVDSKTCTSI